MNRLLKRGLVKKMYFILLVLILVFILSAIFVRTDPPTPHNVVGRVFTNSSDGSGAENGVPVQIDDITSGMTVLTYTYAPPIPILRGSYAATISGNDGDTIIVTAWNDTNYGQNSSTLAPTTTFINVVLNISRPSEANVTIIIPSNHTVKNKSIIFNVTANISILGGFGDSCNAIINFSDRRIMNITSDESYDHDLGNIDLYDFRVTSWKVIGSKAGNSNITVKAECDSDGLNFHGLNNETVHNISIRNFAPFISEIFIVDEINLDAGSNVTLYCNASIIDYNTVSDIQYVNASFYQPSIDPEIPNDNNYKYTDPSCYNTSSSSFESNYTCEYNITYYANNGTWRCNISLADFSNASNISNRSTVINELLAIGITPSIIDYGAIASTETSQEDINITITNNGNVGFNLTLRGFGIYDGDNLSMRCLRGNISSKNERYSVTHMTAFNNMLNISNESTGINDFILPQRTNDLVQGSDRNKTYWKLQVPPLVRGPCNGTVVFNTIII